MIVGRFHLDIPDYRDPGQLWVAFTTESPYNTYLGKASLLVYKLADLSYLDKVGFNATMGYMRENDFHKPYANYRYRNDPLAANQVITAGDKTRLVMWLVSNCIPTSRRPYYVRQLLHHVDVDVYGWCGMQHPCDDKNGTCFREHMASYKFYLAFENSECRDYMSEKFWRSLELGVVPVVMGAYIEDYTALAPPDSFIHVDNFTSPRHLAAYLNYLDKNDAAYDKYLAWRQVYEIGDPTAATRRLRPGAGIQHNPLCKMCAIAHDPSLWTRKSYRKLSQWYGTKRLCKQ
jgi:glycoprotein 3-alpha-L-fucosyltransferase